ncbi:MAG TPA: Uma2 family endonuclease [Gemmata sp.]|nr:Uma2 family endonuclease [Gemmata sp.]
MPTVLSETYGKIRIPEGLTTLSKFLRWLDTTDLPEKLPIRFYQGEVWVDLMEELFSHSRIKSALGIVLGGLIENDDLGMYVPDGMLLANEQAELVTEPDAMFLSNASIAAKRVRFAAGKKRGAVATRVVGSPDLVVEIVSPSSEHVDTAWLMSAYHDAGVAEYWVIDARNEDGARFDIYKRGAKEFTPNRKQDGWVKSGILGKSFRLAQTKSKGGYPRFTLEVR